MEEKKKTRAKLACDFCKKRKVKCDVEINKPCFQCRKKNIPCVLSTPMKRGRKPGPTKLDSYQSKRKFSDVLSKSSPTNHQKMIGNQNQNQIQNQNQNQNQGQSFGSNGYRMSNVFQLETNRPRGCSLIHICVATFKSTAQPQFPFFKYSFLAIEASDIWFSLQEGISTGQITSWERLCLYLRHALVFVLGSYLLGLETEQIDIFMRKVCDNYLRHVEGIPKEQVPEIVEMLIVKSFYHYSKNDADLQYQSMQILNTLFDVNLDKMSPIVVHSVLSLRLINHNYSKALLVEQLVKVGEVLEDPASESVMVAYLLIRLLDYQHEIGWNGVNKNLDQNDSTNCLDLLSRAEFILQKYPHKTEWVSQFGMIILAGRSAIYAANNFVQEANYWIGKALAIANTIYLPGTLVLIFLRLIVDICKQLNLPEVGKQAQLLMHKFSDKGSSVSISSVSTPPESPTETLSPPIDDNMDLKVQCVTMKTEEPITQHALDKAMHSRLPGVLEIVIQSPPVLPENYAPEPVQPVQYTQQRCHRQRPPRQWTQTSMPLHPFQTLNLHPSTSTQFGIKRGLPTRHSQFAPDHLMEDDIPFAFDWHADIQISPTASPKHSPSSSPTIRRRRRLDTPEKYLLDEAYNFFTLGDATN